MIEARALVDAWNAFFHTPEPPTTVAVFRIAFGGLLICNALLTFREAALWYGPEGLLGYEHYLASRRKALSLFRYLPPNVFSVYLILSLHLGAAVLLTIGLFTRASTVAVFVTLVSLSDRNPLCQHSGDAVLRLMSFLLIFSPAGEALSLDRALAGGFEPPAAVSSRSPWCLRLMQLQVSFLYFRTFLWKLGSADWLQGRAVYYPTQLATYQRIGGSLFSRRPLQRVATWSAMAVEFALGPLVWVEELRYPVLASGFGFHLAIELFLNLQLFGWTMMVCLLLFVAPAEYVTALQRLGALLG